jgi:NAD(P)-dependent dehydrogenase (short-subunit alcohol dehydrogenase family)/acyl carrier protein
MDAFGFIVCNPPHDAADLGVVAAAAHCGAIGVLNCADMDMAAAQQAIARLQEASPARFGVKLSAGNFEMVRTLPAAADWVILGGPSYGVGIQGPWKARVLVEVASADQAARAIESGCHGLIARGEALAKQLAAGAAVPVWVSGIGPGAAGACHAAGIAGVVIEQAPLADALHALPVILHGWRQALRSNQALPAADPPGSADAVMLQFQQLMAQFLETQAAVMTAYLQGASATAPARAPEKPPVAAVTPAGTAARDCLAELCRIAGERTGYPPELLDPDAAVEADLGIDSIKRLEILTAFQKRCTAAEQAKIQEVLEGLAGARTLREIAGRMAAVWPASAAPAAPPAASVSSGPGRDYIAELRQIASERTGYPPEMLDLDAAIEADLGIDSIKRAEVLSGFQKLCTPAEQQKVQAIMDRLAGARTLREIAERIAVVLPGPAEGKAMPAGAAGPVPRFVLTVTARPRRPSKPRYYPGRIAIITDDETGIAAGVAEELNRAGERALLLRHNPDAVIGAEDLFTADLTDAAAIESTVGMIRQEYGPIGAIIHLLPLRSNGSAAGCSLAEWRELVKLDVRSLYALARAAEADLKQASRAGGALLAAVTGRGGDFGLHPGPAMPPTHFAVADFAKALALEFTDVLCKVVDLDATDPVVILQKKLTEELTSPDETLQVGLPGDRRLTVVPQAEPLAAHTARQIQRDWVILVTGGARGITAEVARRLAEHCQPLLVLAGTSPLPGPESPDTAGLLEAVKIKAALTARLQSSGAAVKPAAVEAAYQRLMKDREISRTLEALTGAGSRVEYQSVDVRDEAAFGGLIERIYRDHGRLDVVIHGAGIAEDKRIRDKTPESFDRVVHTKADSAFLLSRKLRPEGLQCLLFMSSITAAFGGRAQADFAAANGILNGFASMLAAQWPARVVAVNWGPWDHAGTVTEEVRQQFLSRCVHMIPLAGGAEATLREIEAGPPHDPLVALGEGPWARTALPAGTPRPQIHAFGGMP